jgi:hypothetical protein
MKKLIALFTVLLIVTGAAFAQYPDGLTIGGWGRTDFAVVQGQFPESGDPTYVTGVGSGWGPAYMGFNLNYTALDGRMGTTVSIAFANVATGDAVKDDNLYIWAKPFGSDILKIYIGSFNEEEFRGYNPLDNDFSGWVNSGVSNKDRIFTRIQPRGGALFLSKPTEGLSVYASVDPGYITLSSIIPSWSSTTNSWSGGPGAIAGDVYKSIQAGLGYEISGIGLARVQYIGGTGSPHVAGLVPVGNTATYTGITYNAPVIEAAFKVTALEGLTLDIGGKIPIPGKENNTAWGDLTVQDNFQLNLAGDYKAGSSFGVNFAVFGTFGGSVVSDQQNSERLNNAPTFDLEIEPYFFLAGLDSTLGVAMTLGIIGDGEIVPADKTKESTNFALGAWISRNLGPGNIKTGLSYVFPTYRDSKFGTAGYFSWPIIMSLGF